MTYEICAILAVLIFAILAIYIIRTLIVIQKALKEHTILTNHLDENLKKMDSTFRSISNLGHISEEKTLRLREQLQHVNSYAPQDCETTDDVATLLLTILKLGSKFLKRK